MNQLDLLLGFILLMLAASTVVATATQCAAAILSLRARHLRRAIEELLAGLDPARLSALESRELAALLLHHPYLAGCDRRGVSALRREDFIRLLLEIAASDAAPAAAIRLAFALSDRDDARRAAQAIGHHALLLERESPAEPAASRDVRAIVAALGPLPVLARIHAWYAIAMARATRRYMRQTRLLAAVLALALVAAVHPFASWRALALSWLFISLGAPFWYDRLKDLLHLRPSA